ncbi:MAG TPA: hypothetical protein VNA22_05920 [Pyrinomonadaceae bacterium]|nr:hypothetical protein [Pyrinomonadaceae bacterium]
MLKIFLQIAVILACSVTLFAQAPEASATKVGIAEIYLAKDDGSGKAGDEATSFVTTDVPIYCVVKLDSAAPVTVKMNLVAVSVPGVKAETRVVSTSYTLRENEDRVNFSGRPAKVWVAGKYRVDIFVGAGTAVSREFAVQKAAQANPASKPAGSKTADKSPYAGPLKKN